MISSPATPSTPAPHPKIHVSLTSSPLSLEQVASHVRSPKAGAIVLFAGTTRDNFSSKPVKQLTYEAYTTLAERTMQRIAQEVAAKHSLQGIAVIHRLGTVPIGEESVIIAVSAAHRQAAWRAGEECLEEVKGRVEIWKREEFEDGGIWRANRDGAVGERVDGVEGER